MPVVVDGGVLSDTALRGIEIAAAAANVATVWWAGVFVAAIGGRVLGW